MQPANKTAMPTITIAPRTAKNLTMKIRKSANAPLSLAGFKGVSPHFASGYWEPHIGQQLKLPRRSNSTMFLQAGQSARVSCIEIVWRTTLGKFDGRRPCIWRPVWLILQTRRHLGEVITKKVFFGR